MTDPKTTKGGWFDWQAEMAGFTAIPGKWISVSYPEDEDCAVLNWDETVALHAWLTELIEAAK